MNSTRLALLLSIFFAAPAAAQTTALVSVATIPSDALFVGSSERMVFTKWRTLSTFTGALADSSAPIVITVHTDRFGPEARNLVLSQRQADEVKRTLVQLGIEARRIRAVGVGESMPVDRSKSAGGERRNRRVEISIMQTTRVARQAK